MYCRAGQSTEEEMYNNQDAGPAFIEFLETIGQKVRLKGFDKYKAGLDNKSEFIVFLGWNFLDRYGTKMLQLALLECVVQNKCFVLFSLTY